ncbi:hypothetical protein P167DRAFT_532526 [Morchella conica CCBAS932]|uniref:Uncharacterized protein n=1 Tax=Morchella conica CCBAS932 TaxID=1392247 RepID=A0A3N4KZT9_9PEZI|nr:hypothetical protein P167DRAFT_532526 [Morchella conica CCBAS932]
MANHRFNATLLGDKFPRGKMDVMIPSAHRFSTYLWGTIKLGCSTAIGFFLFFGEILGSALIIEYEILLGSWAQIITPDQVCRLVSGI